MTPPFFSIVVPTYNRPQELANCLETLTQLAYPSDRYEIIIVDDGSSTPMTAVVKDFQQQALPQLTLIVQENTGPGAARNRGVEAAKGDYIAFTDDDCMPTADWLSQFADALTHHPQAMVGGRTLNALPTNLYSSASQALIDYLYSYYDSSNQSAANQGTFFASNNIAMLRSRFLSIGGFDLSFPLAAAEDRNLCDCWGQAGYPMVYVPTATIRHAHSLTLKSFWRQHFGYGRGAFCFHKIRARRTEKAIKVEPLKFYTELLAYPLRQEELKAPFRISGLFFLSQVATTTGFFWERWSQQRSLGAN